MATPDIALHSKRRMRTLPLILLLIFVSGCGGYGEVSPKAYEFSTAIYSIANLQSQERLDIIGEKIEAAGEAGEISKQEHAWFEDILNDARDGKWDVAGKAARRMMEDQVTKK